MKILKNINLKKIIFLKTFKNKKTLNFKTQYDFTWIDKKIKKII
jgi:hypothetical protein